MLAVFDSFLGNNQRWFVGSKNGYSAQVKNRLYEIDHQIEKGSKFSCGEIYFDYDKFFTIDTSFRIIEGDENAHFGIYGADNLGEYLCWYGIKMDKTSLSAKEVMRCRSSVSPKPDVVNASIITPSFSMAEHEIIQLTVCKEHPGNTQLGFNGCHLKAEFPNLRMAGKVGLYAEGRIKVEVYSFNLITDIDIPQLSNIHPEKVEVMYYMDEKQDRRGSLPTSFISDPDLRTQERYQRGEKSNGY